jgi:hypothetical protein
MKKIAVLVTVLMVSLSFFTGNTQSQWKYVQFKGSFWGSVPQKDANDSIFNPLTENRYGGMMEVSLLNKKQTFGVGIFGYANNDRGILGANIIFMPSQKFKLTVGPGAAKSFKGSERESNPKGYEFAAIGSMRVWLKPLELYGIGAFNTGGIKFARFTATVRVAPWLNIGGLVEKEEDISPYMGGLAEGFWKISKNAQILIFGSVGMKKVTTKETEDSPAQEKNIIHFNVGGSVKLTTIGTIF